jgi:hypothetical protein
MAMAMVLFENGTAPSEASMFLPDVDLYELLTGFSQDRLPELFDFALRIDLPSRRALPSNAVTQLRSVGARYQLQVRPMVNVLAALSQIWVLPAGTDESLVAEDSPVFNLGALVSLFALVSCALDDLVLDVDAPLFQVWDRICQATFRAYDEQRMSDWAFVLQLRILVYLMTAMQITRLGESSLNDIRDAARQAA